MNKSLIVSALLLLLPALGCAEKEPPPAEEQQVAAVTAPETAPAPVAEATQASFDALFAEAEAALAKAKEAKFAWTTTQPLLDQAKEAAAAGDLGKAMTLAQEAKMQGELALRQAKEQETAWKGDVVK